MFPLNKRLLSPDSAGMTGETKEEEKKEEVKSEEKTNTDDDGNETPTSETKSEEKQYFQLKTIDPENPTWPVEPRELIELAQLGANSLIEKRLEKDKDKDKDEDIDDVAQLRKDVEDMKKERNTEREIGIINRTLADANDKSEFLKDHPALAEQVNALALAQYNINPRQSLESYHSKAEKSFAKIINSVIDKEKDKLKGNNRLRATMNSAQRGSSSSLSDSDKKYTAEDLKSGASRRALIHSLEQMEQD